MAQQTAVEWFYEQLYGTPRTIWEEELNRIREQANQMFKEQITYAYNNGVDDAYADEYKAMDDYYNQTYNK